MEDLPEMTLWYYPRYRSVRCIWLVKELGIEDVVTYRKVPVGAAPKDSTTEEFRAKVNPHATVPALEISGRAPLLESGAICLFLADLCGKLAPTGPLDRAEYYNVAFYCTSRLDTAMTTLAIQWMFVPEQSRNEQVISKARATAEACLDYLDGVLDGRLYILGDKFSAADCVLGYNVIWAKEMKDGKLLEKSRPNLARYLATIADRPLLKDALELK